MPQQEIQNDTVWILSPKPITNPATGEWCLHDTRTLYVRTISIEGHEGLLVFTDAERAEKYRQDASLDGCKVVKVSDFRLALKTWWDAFPHLAYLILDYTGDLTNDRIISIADFLRPGKQRI